jgi:hypothetical protein
MIGGQDILDRATEWQLRPEVVEKDYILGWVLASLASPPEMCIGWFLKTVCMAVTMWGSKVLQLHTRHLELQVNEQRC